jgi:hypothetical protein
MSCHPTHGATNTLMPQMACAASIG